MPDYRVTRPTSSEGLAMDVIQPAWDAWTEAKTPAKQRRVLDAMTPGQRRMLAYILYFYEVTNGGHSQFFWNSTGDLWQDVLEATKALGVPEHDLIRDAAALWPSGRPPAATKDRRKLIEQMDAKGTLEAFDEKFEALDDRFNELPERDDKLTRYIDEHPNEFFLP